MRTSDTSEAGRQPGASGPEAGAPRALPLPSPRLAQWLRLLGRLQFVLLPIAVLAAPLTGCPRAPGHDLVGGMFVELSSRDVFLVVLPMVMCAWATMATLGLILEGSKLDPPRELPPWTRFFALPPRALTFFAFPALAVPGVFVVVRRAVAPLPALAAALGAAAVAYAGAVIIAALLTAAHRDYAPIPDPLARRFVRLVAEIPWVAHAIRWTRRQVSNWLTWPPFDGSWDPEEGEMDVDHFVALGFCTATFAVFIVQAFLFRPGNRYVAALPPGALLITLGVLLVWMFGALTFHLRRYRLSPVLVMVGIAALGYGAFGYDHHFHVQRRGVPALLTPQEVVAPVGDGNLVVVATTGGGILAAGWTTLALERLVEACPSLRREIRLLSGASGGSVGGAFYIAGLREQEAGERGGRPLADVLREAHARAVASSLDAVAYGLVFLDVPRLLTGGLAFGRTDADRGYYLEKRWRNLAAGEPISMHDLGALIKAGVLPAPIFNITAMETGRRVMATPVTFGSGDHQRAPTLDEYLLSPTTGTPAREPAGTAPPADQVDIDLWTAARLSATFPFVTPAARAYIDQRNGTGAAGHHMIDGGYNDNYGVASTLDFLAPVMAARKAGALGFKRLLIIQLRGSNPDSPVPAPAPGIEATLIGPLIGILNVRDGATLPRNEAALGQFLDLASDVEGLRVKTVVFQPQRREPATDTEEPLSWHMTGRQKADLRQRWDSQPGLASNLCAMRSFLEDRPDPSCP